LRSWDLEAYNWSLGYIGLSSPILKKLEEFWIEVGGINGE